MVSDYYRLCQDENGLLYLGLEQYRFDEEAIRLLRHNRDIIRSFLTLSAKMYLAYKSAERCRLEVTSYAELGCLACTNANSGQLGSVWAVGRTKFTLVHRRSVHKRQFWLVGDGGLHGGFSASRSETNDAVFDENNRPNRGGTTTAALPNRSATQP